MKLQNGFIVSYVFSIMLATHIQAQQLFVVRNVGSTTIKIEALY